MTLYTMLMIRFLGSIAECKWCIIRDDFMFKDTLMKLKTFRVFCSLKITLRCSKRNTYSTVWFCLVNIFVRFSLLAFS